MLTLQFADPDRSELAVKEKLARRHYLRVFGYFSNSFALGRAGQFECC
jgi:hypothetical protein